MAKIIILYSTTDNYTIKICNKIKDIIEENNNTVVLLSIDDEEIHLNEFDQIIIGASIRYGKHNKEVYEFINKNQQIFTRSTAPAVEPLSVHKFSIEFISRYTV